MSLHSPRGPRARLRPASRAAVKRTAARQAAPRAEGDLALWLKGLGLDRRWLLISVAMGVIGFGLAILIALSARP